MTFSQIYNDPFAFTRVGVSVLLINDTFKVLAGKRIGSHGSGTYAFPGGHLDKNESFQACAIREVLEETGIDLRYPLVTLHVTQEVYPDVDKHYVTVFLMTKVDEDQLPENKEPAKCEGWSFYSLNVFPQPFFPAITNLLNERSLNSILDAYTSQGWLLNADKR